MAPLSRVDAYPASAPAPITAIPFRHRLPAQAMLKIDRAQPTQNVNLTFASDLLEEAQTLWPGAVVIGHLSRDEWQHDCITAMLARGYSEAGKTPEQHVPTPRPRFAGRP